MAWNRFRKKSALQAPSSEPTSLTAQIPSQPGPPAPPTGPPTPPRSGPCGERVRRTGGEVMARTGGAASS